MTEDPKHTQKKEEAKTSGGIHLPLSVVSVICGALFVFGGISFKIFDLDRSMVDKYSIVTQSVRKLKLRLTELQDEANIVKNKTGALFSLFSTDE